MPFFPSMPDDAGPPIVYTRYPDIYGPWSEMSEAMMNGPSAFSAAERELLFSFAAGALGSKYVYAAHSEVAYARGYENGLLDRLLQDINAPGIDDRLRPVLAYMAKLAREPDALSQADADAVFGAGWQEQGLHDAIVITARAAFMHRLTTGHGFIPMSRETAIRKAKARIEKGYVNLYPSLAERKPAPDAQDAKNR
jgi:alkylhydroperoxidase family enzyme